MQAWNVMFHDEKHPFFCIAKVQPIINCKESMNQNEKDCKVGLRRGEKAKIRCFIQQILYIFPDIDFVT